MMGPPLQGGWTKPAGGLNSAPSEPAAAPDQAGA